MGFTCLVQTRTKGRGEAEGQHQKKLTDENRLATLTQEPCHSPMPVELQFHLLRARHHPRGTGREIPHRGWWLSHVNFCYELLRYRNSAKPRVLEETKHLGTPPAAISQVRRSGDQPAPNYRLLTKSTQRSHPHREANGRGLVWGKEKRKGAEMLHLLGLGAEQRREQRRRPARLHHPRN